MTSGSIAGQLASALDHLEAVTASGLAEAPTLEDLLAGEKPDEGAEAFPASVVLENCAAMFRGEAERAGAQLRIGSGTAAVHTDPVALMRAVSNLVSNALKHAGAKRVLIGAQRRGDHVDIRVIDDGKGMTKEELVMLRQSGAKGEASEGHGLGLALVQDFARQPRHDLSIRSKPGKGTAFTLLVPTGR